MKLICELNEDMEILTEDNDSTGGKDMYIQGIFLQGVRENRNKRVYPMAVLRKEVARYTKTSIKGNSAWGELGHPAGPTINPERISHRIVELKENGNNFVGKAKLTNTPYGKIARNLIEDGGRLGISSRGLGSLKAENGSNVVQDDFYLATAGDLVTEPSAQQAWVEGIYEHKEWIFENGIIREIEIEQMRNNIVKASTHELEEVMLREFQKFLGKL